jgi:ribonuclease HI
LKKHFTINIDGASRGNPGPAGIGVVIRDAKGRVVKKLSLSIGNATNNIAEYTAMIYALKEALTLGASSLDIFTDSQLVARQIEGVYKIKDKTLKPLFAQAQSLIKKHKKVTVAHVAREENKEADTLAKKAVRENPGVPGGLAPTHVVDFTQLTFEF